LRNGYRVWDPVGEKRRFLVKKLQDIPNATGNSTPGDTDWEKDRLIERLAREGHKTISVDRAVLTIEQCEAGEDFPPGWCSEPLKVTVYADPDAGFGGQDALFIHAGRSGLMDVLVQRANSQTGKMVALPAQSVNACAESDFAQVAAILHLAQNYLTGYYQKHCRNRAIDRRADGSPVQVAECIETDFDSQLSELGVATEGSIQAYLDRLREIPDVFVQWDKDTG
jgi:hypothetical protein